MSPVEKIKGISSNTPVQFGLLITIVFFLIAGAVRIMADRSEIREEIVTLGIEVQGNKEDLNRIQSDVSEIRVIVDSVKESLYRMEVGLE